MSNELKVKVPVLYIYTGWAEVIVHAVHTQRRCQKANEYTVWLGYNTLNKNAFEKSYIYLP